MLPANRDDRIVQVHRSLDAEEDDLLDAVTAFAETHHFEVDRRDRGPGLLFCATSSGELFKRGDSLRVVITATQEGHDVELVADIQRSISHTSQDRSRLVVRGYALAGLFGVLGVRGLVHNGADFGDLVLFLIGAGFARRSVARAQSTGDKIDELHRRIANELNAVCDEAERV